MKTLFIDSGYFIALASERDLYHERALTLLGEINKMREQNRISFVTTRAVLIEVARHFSKPSVKQKGILLLDGIERDALVEVIPLSETLYRKGYQLFCERLDKKWSLCDCISFVVMNERGISDALAVDADFEQAGFTLLLK